MNTRPDNGGIPASPTGQNCLSACNLGGMFQTTYWDRLAPNAGSLYLWAVSTVSVTVFLLYIWYLFYHKMQNCQAERHFWDCFL